MKITDTAQYRDATNNRFFFYLHSSPFFPSKSPQRLGTTRLQMTCPISDFSCHCPWILLKCLSTMMLQVTDVFWFFPAYFPYNPQKQLSTMTLQITHANLLFLSWNVPEISQKRLGTKLLQITRVILFFYGICNEKHQNGSVPWCYKWQISSTIFIIVPMNFIKTAPYHDATTNMRHLIFLQVFPWQSPKRLSTMMPQIPAFLYVFRGISHEIH